MNGFKLTSILCGGMLSLAGTTLLAQSPSQSSQPSEQSPTADQSQHSSSFGQSSAAGLSGEQSQHGRRDVRLSELMNATVQSRDGKTLGQIRDLTMNPQSGRIDFAVLSLSPSAGAESSSANQSSTTSATGAQSSSAALGNQQNGSSTPGQSATGASGNPSATSSQLGASATASTEAGKLIPVPWQLFRHGLQSSESQTSGALGAGQSGSQTLVLTIDESKLQSAPSFTSSDWTELQQPGFHQQVYSFYGVNRMSGVGTSGGNISGQGESSETNDRSAKGGASDLLQDHARQQTPQENK